jgi:hypothetical protein
MQVVKPMELQKQPTEWACLPTAFAMCLGMPVAELISDLGHDGSEPFWEGYEGVHNVRAFHHQELYDYCLKKNKPVTMIDAMPALIHYVGTGHVKNFWDDNKNSDRLMYYLDRYHGVLHGLTNFKAGHAIAWNGEKCYDPRGFISELAEANLSIRHFHVFL